MIYEVRKRHGSRGRYPRNIEYNVTKSGCWECVSHCLDGAGYVQIRVNGQHTRVHRYVYEKEYGVIPKGLEVRHTCDNRKCMNPDHLILGTHQDNMNDAVRRDRMRSNGHTPEEGFEDRLDCLSLPWKFV